MKIDYMFYVYILKSQIKNSYYVGQTNNLEARIKKHNAGLNKSTKHGIPWAVIYSETFATRSEAFKREQQLKRFKGGRAFKELVQS